MDNRRFNNRNDSDSNSYSRNEQNRFLNPDQDYRSADANFNYRSTEMDYNRGANSRSADMDYNRGSSYRAADTDYNRDSSYRSSDLNYSRERDRENLHPFRDQDRYSSNYAGNQENRSWSAGDRSSLQNDRSFDQGRFDYGRGQSSSYSDRDHTFDSSGWNDRSSAYQSRQGSSGHNEGFMEQAKEAVKSFFGKGPKGYQRSDERIKEDVSEALYRHHNIDASEIEVAVKSGTVTLTGSVPDRSTKRLVEDVVEGCTGVSNVSNLLLVDPNFGLQSQSTTTQASSSSSRSKSIQ